MRFPVVTIVLLGLALLASAGHVWQLQPGQPQVIEVPPNVNVTLSVPPSLPDPNATAFWVFEAHTQSSKLKLRATSSDEALSDKERTSDSDFHPGLVLANDGINASHSVFLENSNFHNVTAVVLVRSYGKKSPVPGVCTGLNSTHNLSHQPGLLVSWGEHTIQVNFSNAGILGTPSMSCNAQGDFEYQVYQRFLDHRNYKEDYFLTELAETMLLPEKIRQYGSVVSPDFIRSPDLSGMQNVLFSAYPGTAAIYAVIVQHANNESSVYVSGATFACNLGEGKPYNCQHMWLGLTKAVCAISIFFGFFVAFCGHRFFPASQFFFAFLAGGLVSYIVFEGVLDMSYSLTVILTVIVASIVGTLWLLAWIFLGIPIVAVTLPTILLGFLFASILFFFPGLNVSTFISDTKFWLTVLGITLLIPIVMLSFAKQASILACVIIGSFAIIVPIDHFSGGSIKYIIVNVVRRATVEDFNWVVLKPPFETLDITLLVSWVSLTFVALIFQHMREHRRAPFPPNPYQLWRWRREIRDNEENESSPLVNDTGDENERYRIGPEVLHEIRMAAREAALEAARIAAANPELAQENLVGSAASTHSRATSSSVPGGSANSGRRSRDIFKPPTPPGEEVYNKL